MIEISHSSVTSTKRWVL